MSGPPPLVREAFALRGTPHPLPGGGGQSWRVGDAVLKPVADPREAAWSADVFQGLLGRPGFRVPAPIRSCSGAWVVDRWAAWRHVNGEPGAVADWPALVAASRAFHKAVAPVPPPPWLGSTANPWTTGDRVAWDAETVDVAPALRPLLDRLTSARRPVNLASQVMHGDCGGDNVLFAPGLAPAIIDFAPYFRPAGWSLAIAAVDALTWEGAPSSILDALADEPEIHQLLVRALIYRLVTESILRRDAGSLHAVREATEPVVDHILRAPGTAPGDRALTAQVARALGEPAVSLHPQSGGHTRAIRRLARRPNGSTAFVKAGPPVAPELVVYQSLAPAPFLPAVLATALDPVPLLVLEHLPPMGDWTAETIADTARLLDEVHARTAPPGLPRLAADPNPWDAVAHHPRRLLRLQVCEQAWLDANLPQLRAAAARAELAGSRLCHLDVQAANLLVRDGRLVLADWGAAVAGNPWIDTHLWLVALHAEGGPAPEALAGADAGPHAAWIAGRQPLLAPARRSDPSLFDLRRRRLAVALAWAARELGLPPPKEPALSP